MVAGYSTHPLSSLTEFPMPSSHWLDSSRPLLIGWIYRALSCLSIDCSVPTKLIVLFVTTNCKNLFKYITNIFQVKNVGTLLINATQLFLKELFKEFFVCKLLNDGLVLIIYSSTNQDCQH